MQSHARVTQELVDEFDLSEPLHFSRKIRMPRMITTSEQKRNNSTVFENSGTVRSLAFNTQDILIFSKDSGHKVGKSVAQNAMKKYQCPNIPKVKLFDSQIINGKTKEVKSSVNPIKIMIPLRNNR